MSELRQCAKNATHTAVHSKSVVQPYLGVRKPGLCGTGSGFESGALDVSHKAYTEIRNNVGRVALGIL